MTKTGTDNIFLNVNALKVTFLLSREQDREIERSEKCRSSIVDN